MNSDPVIRQGWLRAIIGLPVAFVFVRLTATLPRLILPPLGIEPGRVSFAANNLLFLLLAIYLLRRFLDRESMISLGFSVRGVAKDIVAGLAAAFVIMGAGFLILYMAGSIEVTAFTLDYAALSYWAIYLLIAAALEEVPMRGYMLNNMMSSVHRYVAAGIIGLIFGLIHGLGDTVSIPGVINCTLLGVIAGLYYVHARNLWMPIVFHAGWNFFQGTIFGFRVSGNAFDYSLLKLNLSGPDWLTGGSFGLEGSMVLTALAVICIALYEISFRKRDAHARRLTLNAERAAAGKSPDDAVPVTDV